MGSHRARAPGPGLDAGQGRPAAGYCRRDIVDGIRYLVKEGIQWRAMPADFPRWRIIYDYASGWEESGATEGSRGYDAGRKINGRKRHIAVDTIGLLLTVLITAAGVQDRDGAKPLLWKLRKAFPSVRLTWADGGYAGKLVTWAKSKLKPKLILEIVKRPDDLHAFQVLPRRWVVGRTLAWITRCRRTVRDCERVPARHESMVHWAMTITMTRRLARRRQAVRPHYLQPRQAASAR
jgi:transposase